MDGRIRAAGIVVAVDENGMRVRVAVSDRAGECVSRCKACGLCGAKKERCREVHVPPPETGFARPPGGRVVVEYDPGDPGLVAAVFFAPPLLGLLFGGLSAHYLLALGDGGFLAGCLTGFMLGFLPLLALRRWFRTVLRPEAKLVDERSGVP